MYVLQEDGFKKLSLRKSAQLCNVSENAPYSHFKNKEELLVAIQEYVTDKLMNCLKTAYETSENINTTQAILDMGIAYVRFFINYPEYYTFLFSQPCLNIDLSSNVSEYEFEPFRYYKEKAYSLYRNKQLDEDRIKYGIVSMWAKVHGVASIASMKGVNKDFEWEDVFDRILVE